MRDLPASFHVRRRRQTQPFSLLNHATLQRLKRGCPYNMHERKVTCDPTLKGPAAFVLHGPICKKAGAYKFQQLLD
jgi:hypothetical protein